MVEDRSSEVKVEEVDKGRLRVRRIDVVDEDNVIRMAIGGQLPGPIIDGVRYPRWYHVSGIMLRDEEGNERGGLAYKEGLGGPLLALDHDTQEGAGLAVRDGTARLFMTSGPRRKPWSSLPQCRHASSSSSMSGKQAVRG